MGVFIYHLPFTFTIPPMTEGTTRKRGYGTSYNRVLIPDLGSVFQFGRWFGDENPS